MDADAVDNNGADESGTSGWKPEDGNGSEQESEEDGERESKDVRGAAGSEGEQSEGEQSGSEDDVRGTRYSLLPVTDVKRLPDFASCVKSPSIATCHAHMRTHPIREG